MHNVLKQGTPLGFGLVLSWVLGGIGTRGVDAGERVDGLMMMMMARARGAAEKAGEKATRERALPHSPPWQRASDQKYMGSKIRKV